MSLGLYLTLLMGKSVPTPVSPAIINALQRVEVSISDKSNDGFQLTFSIGRNGPADAAEYTLIKEPQIKLFNRVIIIITFGVKPKVLIDGIITNHQLNPSITPGKTTLTITGNDLSILMDLEDKTETFPNQNDAAIITKILSSYTQYGLTPKITTPSSMETPTENNALTSQRGTDLAYIKELATKYKHVFYIEPTDTPGVNTAYWGPTDRKGKPQKPLLFNMGEFNNVNSINFQTNALQQTTLKGSIQDEEGKRFNLPKTPSDSPTLAEKSITELSQGKEIIKLIRESGLTKTEVQNLAKAKADISADAITATGELDPIRYGDILRARHPVTIQGTGTTYSGTYYVKEVSHIITPEEYKQKFTLSREGLKNTV